MAKVIKQTNNNLAEAYDLVIADLFHSLKKIKSGGEIKLGELGTLTKRQQKLRSKLHNKTYLSVL